ncbi:DUF4328 domain-containing protein [Streptomyces sp. NPDC002758]
MKSSAVVVCIAVGLNVAVAVALLAAQMRLYAVLGQMSYREPVLAAEMWVGNLWGWLLAAFAGVLFLGWFSGVRDKARKFRPERTQKGRASSMIWWFIPVANLWMPFRITLEIWTSSQSDATAPRRSQLPVIVWWVLFISWTHALGWAQKLYHPAKDAGSIKAALSVGMAADVLCVCAGIAAIVFVCRLTQMQVRQSRDDTLAEHA